MALLTCVTITPKTATPKKAVCECDGISRFDFDAIALTACGFYDFQDSAGNNVDAANSQFYSCSGVTTPIEVLECV